MIVKEQMGGVFEGRGDKRTEIRMVKSRGAMRISEEA